ncbi:MAG: FAD-binding oxidoreductase [Opitutus sp.]|nr:FAD-binding oxidoreductase [Opitutus sp.]
MNLAPAPAPARAFVPFLDEIDGTCCVPAEASAHDIRARVAGTPLRFPLVLDPGATLEEHVVASGFAPASSRFGPYCDNLMGMNWRLLDGRIVRIGERVVKSTTGYDWFRFLLHTGRRFGRPLDYVIRLRPDCGTTGVFLMTGPSETVERSAALLLRDSWMHWFDAVDVVALGDRRTLRVTVHCPEAEWNIFETYLSAFAIKQGLVLDVQRDTKMPADGLPDAVFKTSPEHVLALAGELVRTDGVRCVVLFYYGVVHAYVPGRADLSARVPALAQAHVAGLQALGGGWHSRHVAPPAPSADETAWIAVLEQSLRGP